MNRPRLPLLVIVVAAPLVVATVVVVASILLIPDLGREIAVHWGPTGVADGFAPAWVALVGFAAIALVGPMVAGATLAGVHPTRLTSRLKVVAVLPLWLVGLVGALQLWSSATAARSEAESQPIAAGLAIALVAGFALAAAGWFAAPPHARTSDEPPGVPVIPLPIEPGERVVWLGTAAMSRGARLALVATNLVALASVTAAVVVTAGAAWPLYVVPVLVGLLTAAATAFTVRIDAAGLTVRGSLGIPVFRVPATDIREVRVVEVDPIADFGGWGIRHAGGRRFGIVTRAGDAIEVVRDDGRLFVVTAAGAATGAALLAAVAAR